MDVMSVMQTVVKIVMATGNSGKLKHRVELASVESRVPPWMRGEKRGWVTGEYGMPRDHSHVEVLIQEGAITEEEALNHPMRNFVECCIGGDVPLPDMTITRRKPLESGDVLLACSDGLWSGASDSDIAQMAITPGEALADQLKAITLKAMTASAPLPGRIENAWLVGACRIHQ